MFVFSRRAGENMWINNDVEVTVLAVHGQTVWLGFTGPPGVHIQRAENVLGTHSSSSAAVASAVSHGQANPGIHDDLPYAAVNPCTPTA